MPKNSKDYIPGGGGERGGAVVVVVAISLSAVNNDVKLVKRLQDSTYKKVDMFSACFTKASSGIRIT